MIARKQTLLAFGPGPGVLEPNFYLFRSVVIDASKRRTGAWFPTVYNVVTMMTLEKEQ